jgi:hypothetical protein
MGGTDCQKNTQGNISMNEAAPIKEKIARVFHALEVSISPKKGKKAKILYFAEFFGLFRSFSGVFPGFRTLTSDPQCSSP